MEREARDGAAWSVVERVCLHPVTLPPDGSQTSGHPVNPE